VLMHTPLLTLLYLFPLLLLLLQHVFWQRL
jgi:hypothetical protein